MMRLLDAVEEALARPGPSRDLLVAAAVRERCRPTSILNDWLQQHPDAPEGEVIEAMQIAYDLGASILPATGADGQEAFELPLPVRLQILRQTGAGEARARLGKGTDWTLTEKTFRTMLDGEAISPEGARITAVLKPSPSPWSARS